MPTEQVVFKAEDRGCYADGTYGEDHRRAHLRGLLHTIAKQTRSSKNTVIGNLVLALIAEPTDDYSEEDYAIGLLNDHTESGSYWEMVDGDLMLNPLNLCDSCVANTVNGVLCHEHGCPEK